MKRYFQIIKKEVKRSGRFNWGDFILARLTTRQYHFSATSTSGALPPAIAPLRLGFGSHQTNSRNLASMASDNHLPVTSFRRSSRLKSKRLNYSEENEEVYKVERASSQEDDGKPAERIGSAMLILQSHPTTEEWNGIVAATKNGIALTGTVAERPAGPVVGLVDIGTCDDAYLFRMSLPGVSRSAGDFSCEIEKNGRVLVQGVTVTGQKKLCRESYIFEMQTQHLCPPGNFSISFQLPGPVDHRGFTATLGSDGIFEGIVLRRDQQCHDKVQVEEAQSTPV